MVIGSPGIYPADVSNKFGLYYDEDEDGMYGIVGSQQLTDYHYNSSSSIGYISGSWWDRDPANSQGIFVGMGTITDTDNGSQARIEYDYHYTNNYHGGIGVGCQWRSLHSYTDTGVFAVITEVNNSAGDGSRHDYHSLMPNPINEIIGEKWKVARMSGIFTFHKTDDTFSYAVGSLHPTITIGCMV